MDQQQLIILVLCALAALLHGLSGFGFPMLSTAIVANFYPLSISIVVVLIPCLLLNVCVLCSAPRPIWQSLITYTQRYALLIIASLIGTSVGVAVLFYLSEQYLKLMLGLILLGYVLDQLRARPLILQASKQNMVLFGFAAGVIGGASNAMAPLLILYLMASQHQKNDVVLISNLIFLLTKIVQLCLLWSLIKQQLAYNWSLIIVLSLTAVLMVLIANRFRQHISQSHFRLGILILLGLLGLQALYQALQL